MTNELQKIITSDNRKIIEDFEQTSNRYVVIMFVLAAVMTFMDEAHIRFFLLIMILSTVLLFNTSYMELDKIK